MSSYYHRTIKTEPESPDADLFAVYLKDLMIGDCGSLSGISPQTAPTTPYIEVTEQPKQRDHRFRYPVEGRQAGSIAGERSTSDVPSYPSVQVHNLSGPARVVVSLVTKESPTRPHPHRLVGDNCRDGVCVVVVDPQHPEAIFRKIGVQRTMNKEVENSLQERKKAGVRLSMEINKGKTGKKHNYDMKSVRLYFEVFVETSTGVFNNYLDPICSTTVYDKKDTVMNICRVNINHGTVAGGDELFILCEKVQADDIKVKFHGVDPKTNINWESFGLFGPSDVHRQFAIVCKTPKFVNQGITAAVTVKFKLYRPSDEESSDEVEFTFKPLDDESGQQDIEKKKRKLSHKDPSTYNKYFTTTAAGKPFKTETLGASAQSCSGAPISNPVSNAPAKLTPTPVTTAMRDTSSRQIKQNLRRTLMERGDASLIGSSRPSPSSSSPFHTGTAQPMDINLPVTTTTTTYSSEAHMSSGSVIQQHQPVSQDLGQFNDIPAQAMLFALAMNQEPGQDDDEERQTSEQRITDIVQELMSVSVEAGAAGGIDTANAGRVLVEPERAFLTDIQFSSLDTIDMGALQEVSSSMRYDLVFNNPDTVDMNNVSRSVNQSSDTLG